MLQGKTVLLGVTGGIAAYKIPNLCSLLVKQGVNVEMHSSREGLDCLPQNADVCIYAVRDSALAEVAAQVRMPARVLHLHTSGTMPLSVFGSDKPHAGIIYPFQTFSKERLLEDFTSVPVFVEAFLSNTTDSQARTPSLLPM